MLGRRGQANSVSTIKKLSNESAASTAWQGLAWMGLLTGIFILSFYSVVSGWILSFSWQSLFGGLTSLSAAQAGERFGQLVSDPQQLLFWHSVFMLLTMTIVALGVNRGIEKVSRILMPALMLMLLGLLTYAILQADFSAAWHFMFAVDMSKITLPVVITAIGHAFFTLSLGLGTVMVYGSYLSKEVSLLEVSIAVIVIDTLLAVVAGLVIFPLVFSYGLPPSAGPGLIFQSLPIAFAQMPAGILWGSLFFVLLLFAALTSAISMLEPVVAWLSEAYTLSRRQAACRVSFFIWLLGLLSVLSFNHWAFSFTFMGVTKNTGWFDVFDLLTSNIMLPLGGVLIALFAGWAVHETVSRQELNITPRLFVVWRFLVRYISPAAVSIVLLYQLLSPLFA